METRVDQWKRKLLDLSLRNSLLNVRDTSRFLPLSSGGSFGFDVPPEDGAVIQYKPVIPAKEIKARLKELYTTSRAMFEDSGVNSLFVAVGFLHWNEEDKEDFHRAPLILVPARLERTTGPIGFNLVRTEEDAVVNFCLLELLRSQFKIPVPEIEGGGFGDGDPAFKDVFEAFSRSIKSRPAWSLSGDVALGIFAFDKVVIWKDLDDHIDDFRCNTFVDHLAERKGLYDDNVEVFKPEDVETHLDFAKLRCPLSADASQLTAVLYSELGKSFVLHGPPGTGKSQTITNIIAHNLAIGKKVLFVSEKKAALDVVYKRLDSIGLAPFCLELHSNKSKKANVMRQIQEALDVMRGGCPDGWESTCRDLAAKTAELSRFVKLLHRPSVNGRSVYSCIAQVVGKHPAASAALIEADVARMSPTQIEELANEVAALGEEWRGIDKAAFDGLKAVKTFTWTPAAETEIRRQVDQILLLSGEKMTFKLRIKALRLAFRLRKYVELPLFANPRGWNERLEAVKDNLDGVRLVMSYRIKADQLRGHGCAGFVTALERGDFSYGEVGRVFDESVSEKTLDQLITSAPELSTFAGLRQDEKIANFKEIDARYADTVQKYVVAALSRSLPAEEELAVEERRQLATLKRESAKKKRIMPIRQLLADTMSVAMRYKPCFLMSPLSVAQYLPALAGQFDMVVFDEASQMTVWDAIGPIARGRQLIVVGDPKQLPPTSFFVKGDAVEDDPDINAAAQDLESILDECLANGLYSAYLNWHYRSRHESLIAFSNHFYYDDRLNTFPAAENNDRLGVSFEYVEGALYEHTSHTNRGEAEALVEFLYNRLQKQEERKRSWGIVTFSVSQKKLIEKLIDERFEGCPWANEFFDDSKPDAFFVKNLENVQGDERDVVMFSIAYAPDAEGNFAMMFGPINLAGGERRLNVAITRAREQVIIFSSTHSSAIKAERTNSVGVKHLKALMEYAETGSIAGVELPDPSSRSAGIVGEVRTFLENNGYAVDEKVGRSSMPIDLAVKDPNDSSRYALAIEFDGPMYAAQRTVRDRDVLRASVLSSLGWKHYRLWSIDWAYDRKRAERRLLEALPKVERLQIEHQAGLALPLN